MGLARISMASVDNDRPDPIEQDLDRVDAALAALDAGELDEAEALAAELGDSRAGTDDSPHPA